MKATEKEAEEKRLQKNANQRRQYAQLSSVKKDALLQKKRERYAESKRLQEIGHKASPRSTNNIMAANEPPGSMTGLQINVGPQAFSYLNEVPDTYGQATKGIIIKDPVPNKYSEERNNEVLQCDDMDKGKAQLSFYSSYEIGSTSMCANTIAHPSTQVFKYSEDFPFSPTKEVRHITSNTSCVPDHNLGHAQPAGTHGHTSQETPSRKRGRLSKGSKIEVPNVLDQIADKPLTLPIIQSCKYCHAKRFYHEPNGFCCSNGEVALVSNTTPMKLYDLYTSQSQNSKEFRTYIRTYNNTFAFTSFGVKYDKNLCKRNKGIYTFKVQGQVYHYINELIPTDNEPSYLQLYFYDTDHETENRTNQSNKLNTSIVEQLVDILNANPYANFFRSLTNIADWSDQHIVIKANTCLDQRVFNSPTSSQIAAIWLENTESTDRRSLDIIVYNHSGYKHKVEHYFGCYDPLQYPLLFPFGETGWHQGIERVDRKIENQCRGQLSVVPQGKKTAAELLKKEAKVLSNARKDHRGVSCREYYCYKLQIRQDDQSINSILLRSGRLLQQYVVDMYVKLETCRLDYFKNNQGEIRGEVYQGIVDSIASGETRGSKVGKRIVLPASFTGGPRDMHKRYIDAMTLVQKFGKPDILLTMTCNPNWPEIKSELCLGEESQNRPDLCARIFKSKFELLKDDIIKKEILGPLAAYTYVIEYQKRGLPHAHFALIFKREAKLLSPESYDRIVSAELPDKDIYPHLYEMVVKHMMHGPCGVMNPQNVCMKRDGHCKNHYPKKFCSATTQGDDSYPVYKRRDDGRNVKVRKHMLDNRWVVPYNPYLLAKYDCHINVEVCSSFKVVKYLYKYIYKGHDQIAFNITENDDSNIVDEIKNFQSARWISPVEAMWRIYGFDMNEIRPAVYSLRLHLEGKQLVTFKKYDKLENIIKYPASNATMLTEFFNYNKTNKNAEKFLYKEFPEHFVWDQQRKIWTKRRRNYAIGRIVTANPAEGERYYLRLLLNHIKGPISFKQLRTVDNHTVPTFREAALLNGLLESDNNLEKCLEEAVSYQMPETLRRLFATILAYCSPNNPEQLWDNFEHAMIEDYLRAYINDSNNRARTRALQNINSKLETMGKKFRDYFSSDKYLLSSDKENPSTEIEHELDLIVTSADLSLHSTLNAQQKYAYDIITERVLSGKNGAFFIDGPGGTGKTYLYRAILATVRSKGLIALATATSGVAASILPGGRTAHSRFKIPFNIDENPTCNVTKQGGLAKLIKAAKLIIWDEATMAKKQVIESFNNMLQDINDSTLPFGGKVVIFGGDFRQVLPVIPKATREETIDATLIKSPLWPILEKFRLTENMRARFDKPFVDFLLRIGNGTELVQNDKITIPTNMLLPFSSECIDSIKLLAHHVFPELQQYAINPRLMTNRAILTPTNDYVDEINNLLIDLFPGKVTEYKSFDKTLNASEQGQNEDFINSLTPTGLPAHILVLKKNCHVILLRNIDPPQGLSNGTRLICLNLTTNLIYAEIASGSHEGRKVFIPRILFRPTDNEKNPIPFERKQFPVRLCFAMTINKAQGQTLETVGLYLPYPVFSHGQLYVALSRAKTSSAIKVVIRPACNDNSDYNCTKNVVFPEVLALAGI